MLFSRLNVKSSKVHYALNVKLDIDIIFFSFAIFQTRFNNLEPTGECGCNAGLVWDEDNLECISGGLGAGYIVLIVLGIIIALGIGCFIGKKVC